MAARAPVRVGLVGLGKMGQNHLRVLSLLRDVELVFVHDANAALAQRCARELGLRTDEDLEALLPAAEAVVVCTPTSTHAACVRQAARHVGRIFVEKPLADGLDQTLALAEFVEAAGVAVQVGFIERFNPAVQQLKILLDRSDRVVSVDFTRTNKISARITDVDVVTDLMIHDIDLALYLNGPVRGVTAQGLATGAMIEFASAQLEHANGRFSRIQASRITEKKIRTIQATCTDMFVNCELVRKELRIHQQSRIEQEPGGAYTISGVEQMIEVRPQEPLLSELQAFVAFCRGDSPDIPTLQDGVRAAEACARIQSAIRP